MRDEVAKVIEEKKIKNRRKQCVASGNHYDLCIKSIFRFAHPDNRIQVKQWAHSNNINHDATQYNYGDTE